MTKNYILQKLTQEKEYIQKTYEVDKIGLFGSYAKDTQTPSSDNEMQKNLFNKVTAAYANPASLTGLTTNISA